MLTDLKLYLEAVEGVVLKSLFGFEGGLNESLVFLDSVELSISVGGSGNLKLEAEFL